MLEFFDLGAMDGRIKSYTGKNLISGVMRITSKNKILYESSFGYADDKEKKKFGGNSLFTLYSLSKPFLAIGIMKLYDKGEIDINAHPSEYLPEAAGFDKEVKIIHMLLHTSGLPDFEQNEEFRKKYAPGTNDRLREHTKLLTKYPQYFRPGTGFKYANVNYTLAALIAENVTKMKYSDFIVKEVLVPLGAVTMTVGGLEKDNPDRVKGYDLKDGVRKEVPASKDWLMGSGDLVGTVEDVFTLNGAVKNRLILKSDTWEKVLTPDPLSGMGIGCTVSDWHGKRRITHNGGHTGFRTLHIHLPEDDFDIIFLSNSGYGDARYVISEIVHETFYGGGGKGERVSMDVGYINNN